MVKELLLFLLLKLLLLLLLIPPRSRSGLGRDTPNHTTYMLFIEINTLCV